MTRIVVALAAGIGGFLLAAPVHAQAPAASATPAVTAPPTVVGAGPVMTNDGYTTAPRRGLFGRLRNRTTYSGPGYNTPYPGYGPVYSSPTTAAPMPMPSATTPSTAPSSQPVGDPATLTAPRTVPGTITSRSFYPPGTTISSNGTITLPPGATVVNGQIIPASGTIVTADGTIVPANYSMQSDYYNGSSQPTRRGLFGRLRNRY